MHNKKKYAATAAVGMDAFACQTTPLPVAPADAISAGYCSEIDTGLSAHNNIIAQNKIKTRAQARSFSSFEFPADRPVSVGRYWQYTPVSHTWYIPHVKNAQMMLVAILPSYYIHTSYIHID